MGRSSPRPSSRSFCRRSSIDSRPDTGSRLPVIVGPTAVGKSDFLFSILDERFEVISADSMQVYRGMDIGTAKPSRADLSRLPHHLLDVLEPSRKFSAGEFVRRADGLVAAT